LRCAAGLCRAQTTYQNADEAWAVGVAFYNARNFAASIAPFEAALKLAPDDAFRLKVYDALRAGYQTLPDSQKFIEASEFIIGKSPQAAAWLAAGDKAKALAAATQAEQCTPEQRNDPLAHFWHRVLAAVGEPKRAIPHYEQAIEKAKIQGYVDACKKSLAEARAKAGQ
jgi:tetratricopeptide (TPR) repeat protein